MSKTTFLQAALSSPALFEQKEPYALSHNKKKVILLTGPTNSGKTALSLLIAEKLGNCEIISADSMQVYIGMDIGTAKLSLEERSKVPHHLIDITTIDQPFNVVDFYYKAREAIKDILSRGNIPIIAGGSSFYLHALLYGPPSGPPSVAIVREKLEQELKEKGCDLLFARLELLDPHYAASITKRDKHKIVRALEIITLTKQPVSAFAWKERSYSSDYNYRCWFVYKDKEVLYKKIEERCEQMVQAGLLDEVAHLKPLLLKNSSAAEAIGYRQALEFLETNQTKQDFTHFMERFKIASRHLAKKQTTWFKQEPLFKRLSLDLHTLPIAADLIVQDYLLL